jgi:hypothetical protein
MGFGFDGAAIVAAAAAKEGDAVIVGAAVTAGVVVAIGDAVRAGAAVVVGSVVAAGVMVFAFGSNGRLMLCGMPGFPGVNSLKSNCELCATPLGLYRNPAAWAGVSISPTLTGVVPSDSTTVPFIGNSVTAREEDGASLETSMLRGVPKTEL